MIITDSLAKRLWPNTSPIGEQILIGCQAPQASIVIGVVRDSAVRDVGEPPQPRFYRPFARQYSGGITAVLLETGTDPASVVRILNSELQDLLEPFRRTREDRARALLDDRPLNEIGMLDHQIDDLTV